MPRRRDSLLPGSGCEAAHSNDPGACLLPCFSYQFIKTPLYIVEAQSDSVVLMHHDWLPGPAVDNRTFRSAPAQQYLAEFQKNQSQCLALAMSSASPHGVFNPACFIHTA